MVARRLRACGRVLRRARRRRPAGGCRRGTAAGRAGRRSPRGRGPGRGRASGAAGPSRADQAAATAPRSRRLVTRGRSALTRRGSSTCGLASGLARRRRGRAAAPGGRRRPRRAAGGTPRRPAPWSARRPRSCRAPRQSSHRSPATCAIDRLEHAVLRRRDLDVDLVGLQLDQGLARPRRLSPGFLSQRATRASTIDSPISGTTILTAMFVFAPAAALAAASSVAAPPAVRVRRILLHLEGPAPRGAPASARGGRRTLRTGSSCAAAPGRPAGGCRRGPRATAGRTPTRPCFRALPAPRRPRRDSGTASIDACISLTGNG